MKKEIMRKLPRLPRKKAYTCPACGQVINGMEYEICPECLKQAIRKARGVA